MPLSESSSGDELPKPKTKFFKKSSSTGKKQKKSESVVSIKATLQELMEDISAAENSKAKTRETCFECAAKLRIFILFLIHMDETHQLGLSEIFQTEKSEKEFKWNNDFFHDLIGVVEDFCRILRDTKNVKKHGEAVLHNLRKILTILNLLPSHILGATYEKQQYLNLQRFRSIALETLDDSYNKKLKLSSLTKKQSIPWSR